MVGEESFSMRAIWHHEPAGSRAVTHCLIQPDHYLSRLGPCERQAAAKAPAIAPHEPELPMRLGHDGPPIKAAGGRYERGHRRKSGGNRRSATVINPPAIFMTMRASLMRQVRTMSAPKPRREISVAMVIPPS